MTTVKIGKPHRIIQDVKPFCPNCNYTLDGFSGINDSEAPDNGSFAVCSKCFHLLEFLVNEGGLITMIFAPLTLLMEDNFPLPIKAINKRLVVV